MFSKYLIKYAVHRFRRISNHTSCQRKVPRATSALEQRFISMISTRIVLQNHTYLYGTL